MTAPQSPQARLSPSEKLTLKHVAEGELLEREMDWVAIQRLKGWGLLEERGTRLETHASRTRSAAPAHGTVDAPKIGRPDTALDGPSEQVSSE